MLLMSNVAPPSEGVRCCQGQTEAHVESRNMGLGTIYIAESALCWVGVDGNGFTIPYPSISLHAVSRDLSAFPHECLFMMLDFEDQGGLQGEDEEDDGIREIRFVPADKSTLNIMYQTMCDCQALHPDPEDSGSSGDDDYYGNEEDVDNLAPDGEAQLQRLENMFIGAGEEPVEYEPQIGAASHSVNGHGDDERMEEDQFEDAD